ncbi:PriCT-2 domain-containing protein, partial [bacterium]|nr:PriCT-2 domain-containing protein [bacterium]
MTTNERIHLLKTFFFARDDFVAARYSYTESATGRAVTIPRPAVGGERLDALLRYHLEGPASGLTPKIIFETRKPHGGGKGTAAAIGGERIGSFCLSADARVRWLCLDFDGGEHADALADPMTAAIAAYRRARELEIPAYLECSGSGTGYHLWVFFESLTAPATARKIALAIACTSGAHALTSGEAADPLTGRGVEIYPKAIAQRGRHLGNMVWLPWWHGAAPGGNRFVRIDEGEGGALSNIDPDDFEDMTAEEVDAALARIPAIDDPVVANSATGAKGRSSSRALSETNYDELAGALSAVPNQDVTYDAYISLGMAIHAAFPNDAGLALWEGWCAKSGKNRPHENTRKWNSFVSGGGGVGPATIFKLAGENGWRPRLAPSVSDAELAAFLDVDPAELEFESVTPERQAVLDVLRDAGDFVGAKEVADALNKPYDAARKMLKRMAADGVIAEGERGKYYLPDAKPDAPTGQPDTPAAAPPAENRTPDTEKPDTKAKTGHENRTPDTASPKTGHEKPDTTPRPDTKKPDNRTSAAPATGQPDSPPVARIIPQIAVNNRQLRDVITDAWRVHHVHENASPNPSFFLKNGTIVRIASTNIRGGGTRTAIEEIGDRAMYSHLTRIAGWIKSSDAGVANADPPPR